ncbi:MAG: PfkB family carbohydrate kinase [Candidatus Marsarchaeota archaeon]|nr:PfkB family carbohydrate kinase [Candidatus Marsarchaeota archaeon]
MKIAIVGSFTVDVFEGANVPGGPAYYSSVAASWMGAQPVVYASVGKDFSPRWLRGLSNIGADVSQVVVDHKQTTTSFNISYTPWGRVLKVLSRLDASKYYEEAQVSEGCAYVSFTFSEASEGVLKPLLRGTRVCVDAQGFSRGCTKQGVVEPRAPSLTPGWFETVKISTEDVPGYTEYVDRLVGCGEVKEVVLTSGREAINVYSGGWVYRLKPEPVTERHPTGAGDAFGCAYYVSRIRGLSVAESLAAAASCASLMVRSKVFPDEFLGSKGEFDLLTAQLITKVTKRSV